MPVRATVLPLPEPGHAILRLADLDALPDGLTLSLQRQQGPDSHLADDGWRRTEAWLLPDRVERNKGALEFHLGPEICDRLAGIATVRLRIKEPDIGIVGSTVVAWPQMLTSGAIDPSSRLYDDVVRLRRRQAAPPPPPPEPPAEPELPPPLPPPLPELRAEREAAIVSRPNTTTWIVTAVALLALAAAGVYAYRYFNKEASDVVASAAPPPASPSAAAEPPRKSIRESVAEYFATRPPPESMLAKARDYAQAGNMAGAFLVWQRAAEAGNAQAELELAGFYDPLNQPPVAGFTPDGARAADWYERAALAGLPEAQRKFGLLLAKGGAGLAADPAKARSWLEQAAAQNDPDAKKALEALKKPPAK
jgi:hypothetical protein